MITSVSQAGVGAVKAPGSDTAPVLDEQVSTRERILDIALELFTEHGYEKTSLRQIAESLGYSKAAIYYHFPSKEDILMALHMRLHEFGQEALSAIAIEPGQVSPRAWVAVLDQLVDQVLGHRALFVLHERNRAALEELHRDRHDAAHEDLDIMFRRFVASKDIAPRDRVRMACTVGAVMGALVLSGDVFSDIPSAELGALVRDVARDLMTPAG
ncbi:MAG: TetR/AcrR family transcriptional regulator [Candidatus Limnocylindrales bacterium]